jgi:diguanylate cyclase (GGDEF)-like protein
MDLPAALAIAADVACLGGGVAGISVAVRFRGEALRDRIAARAAAGREGAILAAARRASEASRISVLAVRDAMWNAIASVAPSVDFFLVYECDDAGTLRCLDARGTRAAYYADALLAENSVLTAAVVRGHHVVIDPRDATAFLHPADRAALVVPLDERPESAALLYIASGDASLAETMPLLAAIADQCAPAYRLAREREADRRRAEYDGLTGLVAPKAFRTRLAQLVEQAERDPRSRLALLFIDTDRFKAWNDTYGHASGDALLRAIAGCILASTRRGEDIAARNGGDEFCAVFTETEKSAAIERADDLRRAIAAIDLDRLTPDGLPARIPVTASIGVAAFPYDATTADGLLELADGAMYRSKHDGRDTVTFCDVDGTLRGVMREVPPSDALTR